MRKALLRQSVRVLLPCRAVTRKRAGGVQDLVAPAIVEADVGLKALDAGGDLVRLVDERSQLRRQHAEVAQKAQAVAVLLHRVDALVQVLLEKLHDAVDLVLRPLPVLGRKGVDRQVVDAEILAVGAKAAEGLRAGLVARRARQGTLLRPAAVAVHNDGNMTRQVVQVNLPRLAFFGKEAH